MSSDEVFNLLYVKYVDDLYWFGISLGYRDEVVKDAIHDVFLKLFSSKIKPGNVRHWKPYLFRSLNNKLIDFGKNPTQSLESDRKELESLFEDGYGEFEKREKKTFVREKLMCLINNLPYKQRVSIHLRFFEEMSYDEIAEVLECSNHAVRISVSKAIQNLRKYNALLKIWQD